MKKTLSIVALLVVLLASMLLLTGCGDKKDSKESKKKDNVVTISYENGKGTFTVEVPKDEEGNPKYEFTKEKPEGAASATFYIETDKAYFSFATSGLVYNTAQKYKEKYGDVKATFDGYLDWIHDEDSGIKLGGMEELTINGRKAIRYYNRTGGSGDYVYYGYNYRIAGDDFYPGSGIDLVVKYKTDEELKEAKEFDQETLDIINSLKVVATNN